jgi:hypothetical protein
MIKVPFKDLFATTSSAFDNCNPFWPLKSWAHLSSACQTFVVGPLSLCCIPLLQILCSRKICSSPGATLSRSVLIFYSCLGRSHSSLPPTVALLERVAVFTSISAIALPLYRRDFWFIHRVLAIRLLIGDALKGLSCDRGGEFPGLFCRGGEKNVVRTQVVTQRHATSSHIVILTCLNSCGSWPYAT